MVSGCQTQSLSCNLAHVPTYKTCRVLGTLLAVSFSLTSPRSLNSPHTPSSLCKFLSPPTRRLRIGINPCKCVVDQARKYLLTTFMLVIFSKREQNSCLYRSYRVNTNVTFLYEHESHDSELLIQHSIAFDYEK